MPDFVGRPTKAQNIFSNTKYESPLESRLMSVRLWNFKDDGS